MAEELAPALDRPLAVDLKRLVWRPVVTGAIRALPVIVVLIIWEASVKFGLVNPFFLPAFSDIVASAWTDIANGLLTRHILATAFHALSGFGLAALFGVAIGAGMTVFASVRYVMDPIVSLAFPIPKIAFMPIFILWFGLGGSASIYMILFNCIIPIISATYLGTRQVDKYMIWSARNLGTPNHKLFWKVTIPAAAPSILSGLQIALPQALVLAIVTEMLLNGDGLGGYLIRAIRISESAQAFGGLLVVLIMGFLFMYTLAATRARLLVWHSEVANH